MQRHQSKLRAFLRIPAGWLLLALVFWGLAGARAQFEIKSGVFNPITPKPDGNSAVSVVESSASSGILPQSTAYPSSVYTVQGVSRGVTLLRSSVGTTFASGVPRYALGERILPPSTIASVTGVPRNVDSATFWRAQPLVAGEVLTDNAGDTRTAKDYQSGSDAYISPLAAGVLPSYYYSPHAKAVFANTPGMVSVTWVSKATENGRYIYFREVFNVSSVPAGPIRSFYWTEKSFAGPTVVIPSGRIQSANPVFSNAFPETVASEEVIPGDSAADPAVTAVLRTFWFEKQNGQGRFHAYNRTGRLLVEYLGDRLADGTYEFLGLDVVNVERSMPAVTASVDLGKEIRPSDGAAFDAQANLVGSPSGSDRSAQTMFYGSVSRPDGSVAYYAERTNDIPERVRFYWLEPLPISQLPSDLGLADTGLASNSLINWPRYHNQYTLNWPTDVTRFAHYTVDEGGSSVASGTGVQFLGGTLPIIVYQDAQEGDALLDTVAQRLVVNLNGEADQLNRALLKFTGTNGSVWYVPLMTQSMGRNGYLEGDGLAAVTGTAYVGERLQPPSAAYSTAGYVAAGNCYAPGAYINPFSSGAAAAEKGAIIPVNALPGGQTTLTVWWFKKIPANSPEFSDFYVPAKIGRYTVAYRESSSALASTDSFEQAPVAGWSDNRRAILGDESSSNGFLGPFSDYAVGGFPNSTASGEGPVTTRSYSLGAVGAEGVTFSFRLYRFDAWTNNTFRVHVMGASSDSFLSVLSETFSSTNVTAARSGTLSKDGVTYSYTMTPGAYGNIYGGAGEDQIFDVSLRIVPTTAAGAASLDTVTLGFGSDLASSAGSFGVDDVTLGLPVPRIVMASNQGTGTLPTDVAAGFVYNQPDSSAVGYNPNEEHALIVGSRAYALRDDLNVVTGTFTSTPRFTSQRRVLIQYTSSVDQRPAMAVFNVLREDAIYQFDYPVNAGTLVNTLAPMPLGSLPPPIDPVTGLCRNTEVNLGPSSQDPPKPPATGVPSGYNSFTYTDRKGYSWVYRGPHDGSASPAFGMQYYYSMRPDFVFPGRAQPPVGTPLPYLRPTPDSGVTFTGDAVTGAPLSVVYRPSWPESVPSLSVGETLALAKNGLPGVRGQSSVQLLYQQSIALGGVAAPSATLVDPTRAKSVLLNDVRVGLTALPVSLKTTLSRGKTYFQLAQPHLQQRFYFDPTLGSIGGLVLVGEFVNETAGEDYFNLNALSAADLAALKGLVSSEDTDCNKWIAAVDALTTRVQTFVESTSRRGTYVPGSAGRSPGRTITVNTTTGPVTYNFSTLTDTADAVVDAVSLAQVQDSNTAVDSYALTALGKGAGYVTLLFGDGTAFTPVGEPVTMQVVKVVPTLYKGDLKALFASNPLDEQVALRHSGDFAARPENYEFQWAYQTADGTPPVYSFTQTRVLGSDATNTWKMSTLPSASPSVVLQLSYPDTVYPFPRALQINPADYNPLSLLPARALLSTSGVNRSGAIPESVFFSAALADADGFVLYVNGYPVLAFNLPDGVVPPDGLELSAAITGLVSEDDGLRLQFELPRDVFQPGDNRVEVALYSSEAAPSTTESVDFRVHVRTKTDLVATGSQWKKPDAPPSGPFTNILSLGGAAASIPNLSLLLFEDCFFTVRYRARTGAGLVTGNDAWTEWTEPVFVPSWVKRVLDGINPFNQRQTDLENNPISTDVSVLTQAGTRWEGDVALNLSNINDFGLIEIYETVLNRVKAQSIGAAAPVSNDGVDRTLLLAAGYLSDLYMILGNEAADDARNTTLQIDGNGSAEDITTARFSFEGQVASLLDESLALWRGRDDFETKTQIAPAYNRLYWNYTNGIRSGEPIYALNYNIREKSGVAANGIIDAADAQKLYPQGHGDAYGHYLTALKVYYQLITNSAFTWTPSEETVAVLGQSVAVDYKDERKFAVAAAALAEAGYNALYLTARENFEDGDNSGWAAFSEAKVNKETDRTRYWGTDEWAARSYQGAFFNWINGNAMLPVEDTVNEGIAKIDRSTVPELGELATTADHIFTVSGGLQAFINPLGLAVDAMTFDISPADLAAGKTHFEQIYDRAVQAGVNAKEAFLRSSRMNALLRSEANHEDDLAQQLAEQEASFNYQLVTLFGSPYAGDIGPGALYAQGYEGPDLYHSFFIDKPSALVSTDTEVSVSLLEPVGVPQFDFTSIIEGASAVQNIYTVLTKPASYIERSYTLSKFSLAQFATPAMGSRREVGKIQSAMLDVYQAQSGVRESAASLISLQRRFERDYQLFNELLSIGDEVNADQQVKLAEAALADIQAANYASAAATFSTTGDYVASLLDAISEAPPNVNGIDNDLTSVVRSQLKIGGATASFALALSSLGLEAKSALLSAKASDLRDKAAQYLLRYDTAAEAAQKIAEFIQLHDQLLASIYTLNARVTELQRTSERVGQLYSEAAHVVSARESFRTRSAAVIQGYRTRDVVYRDVRNAQLAQYNWLFDLAQTYTYCAVKAYDYETGLLKTAKGRAFTRSIIANLGIGEFSGSNPVSARLGDPGLAGVLAAVRDDWAVVKGRLGFNNPERNGTLFSLRQELFRIPVDGASDADNTLWKQVLQQRVRSNLLSDADVVKYCNNISKSDGSAVPGLIIPFSTTIVQGLNFFGWPLAAGDHYYSQSTFATKMLSAGVVFQGYIGMDTAGTGIPASAGASALSATPYVYLIPTGLDVMRTPPLGDRNVIRSWGVKDQALPLPINIGGNGYSSLALFTPQGTVNEELWIPRKHPAFRAVDTASFFYGSTPAEFTSGRLVGRSVWNTQWKLVIPANSLLSKEQDGLNRFIQSVGDIKLFLRTYSNSGN